MVLDPKRVIKICMTREYISLGIIIWIFCMDSLQLRSWKDFNFSWWNALASAWSPGVRHFENLTLWIQLRLGLRDREWKVTHGNSRKLAQLSMTILSKFWSLDSHPICIHGSWACCFTGIAEQIPSEVVDNVFSGLRPHLTNKTEVP